MAAAGNEHVGVVIPTLNEIAYIDGVIQSLSGHAVSEIIISDGGSADGTVERVAQNGSARLIHSPRGRGPQINAGVAALRAEVVIVLHADTRLPDDAIWQVRRSLSDPNVRCGCFRLAFDSQSVPLRLYSWLSRFETYWTTFGDQAFFFRQSDFVRVGGAPDWPMFEDVELRCRFRKIGGFQKCSSSVTTSARRFAQNGVIRTQVLNSVLLLGLAIGISPKRLASVYRSQR